MLDDYESTRREPRVRAVRPRRPEYAETQARATGMRVAQQEAILVQQHRLEELQRCQRRLTSLVEGYLLALEQADLCRDIRTDLELSAEEPQELSRYRLWDGIRKDLDRVHSFSADLAPPESEVAAAIQDFRVGLDEAKAQVSVAIRQSSRLDPAQLGEIVESVLGSMDRMVASATAIARECKEETLKVLSQIATCINLILEQPKAGDAERVSTQSGRIRYRSPRREEESSQRPVEFDRLLRPASRVRETRADGVTTSPAERGVAFQLRISALEGQEIEVRALKSPMGEPHGRGTLPYGPADLIAVLKVLELGYDDPSLFSDAQKEVLRRLGLVRDGFLAPDALASIGKGLYRALFRRRVESAFQMALNQGKVDRVPVALQLRFDEEAVDLARYPWELLHDGYAHLVPSGAVELTRYIAYPEAPTGLEVGPPWRLLFLAPRPKDLGRLPEAAERRAVWESLQPLAEPGRLDLHMLEEPTYDALLARIEEASAAGTPFHIIHFDGHGVFARRCPRCREMHYPHLTTCRSCGAPLEDPLGYLAFEGEGGRADLVSTDAMRNLLRMSGVRLAFLSACQSAVVRGESLFGGLGPGLIQAGVPAVVAMQFSIPVSAAVEFAHGFYSALARCQAVPKAVTSGRRRLFRERSWFIPALYLRSADDKGLLFVE